VTGLARRTSGLAASAAQSALCGSAAKAASKASASEAFQRNDGIRDISIMVMAVIGEVTMILSSRKCQ